MEEVFKKQIEETKELLGNIEWVKNYKRYLERIQNSKNIIENRISIKDCKNKIRIEEPFMLYSTITGITNNEYSLRYYGQSIANVKIKKYKVEIDTFGKDKNNLKYFNCNIQLTQNNDWNSVESTQFRSYFQKEKLEKKNNPESKIESLLLKTFNCKKNIEKEIKEKIKYIKPITLDEGQRVYFQMPTPISASLDKIKEAKGKRRRNRYLSKNKIRL